MCRWRLSRFFYLRGLQIFRLASGNLEETKAPRLASLTKKVEDCRRLRDLLRLGQDFFALDLWRCVAEFFGARIVKMPQEYQSNSKALSSIYIKDAGNVTSYTSKNAPSDTDLSQSQKIISAPDSSCSVTLSIVADRKIFLTRLFT